MVLTACGHVSGQFEASLADGERWVFKPGTCFVSGARPGAPGDGAFSPGVTFVSRPEPRYAIDLAADAVVIRKLTSDEALRLTPAECSLFEGDIRPSSLRVNGVRAKDGSLDIVCERGKERLEGHLRFSACNL
jgi:hypothetical protein